MIRLSFHRPARIVPPALPQGVITVPAPRKEDPAGAGAGGSGWMSLFYPLMSSVSLAGYMIIGHQPVLMALGVGFVTLSVVVVFTMRWQSWSRKRQADQKRQRRYRDHLARTWRQAREVRAVQRRASGWTYPSPERLWGIANTWRRVWERRPADADFLRVRLGTGVAPLVTPLQLEAPDEPDVEYDHRALSAAKALVAGESGVPGQPLLCDLAQTGIVTMVGPPERTAGLARAVLLDIAVLHAPEDVLVAVVAPDRPGDWKWAKWLPHTHDPDRTCPTGPAPLVTGDVAFLEEFLQGEIARAAGEQEARRRAAAREAGRSGRRLVVVLQGYDPGRDWTRSPAVTGLLEAADPGLGLHVICLTDRDAHEPTRSDLRVGVDGAGSVTVTGRRASVCSPVTGVRMLEPPLALCEATARALAPLRLSEEREEALARTINLPAMLGVDDLAGFDPARTWLPPDSPNLLRVPIGLDAASEDVLLDLKESAQGGMGPHGLIVGATGSGKSELLRTLLTGLAVRHPPELLSLVLVDFKGGATFAGVTELPHVAGLITNLADDLHLVDRVQAALHGEQQRRQRLLREAGNVDSIRDYQLKRAAGHTDAHGRPLPPLPYMLVIVDEFGELLTQRPDFVDLFVQIGRVGRSLGIHLLLATQRLEEGRLRGLESHLSYRICLRTFSAAESRAVLGTPDAYQLPTLPGSAYLKVDESVYSRFRVAHVSAPALSGTQVSTGRPAIGPLEFTLRTAAAVPADDDAETAPLATPDGPTQMQLLVHRLMQFGQPTHQVWLPPLPPAIPLDALLGPIAIDPVRGMQAETGAAAQHGPVIPVGVLDLPARQQQRPLVLDPTSTHGHLALVGASQSGKTTLLRTMLLAAMLGNSPDQAQFYCLDFGGGGLTGFEQAPHVAGVAGRGDPERARRALWEVRRLVEEREALFRSLGIDSVATFRRRHRAGSLPAEVRAAEVFLILDNWASIRAELEEAEDAVLTIAARGLGVGVHVIVTAHRWADIRMNLRDLLTARLELRLNDPAESEVSRGEARHLRAGAPGRGIAPPGLLFQAALPRLDGRETDEHLAEAQEEAIAKIAAAWTGRPAPELRTLPGTVHVSELADADADADRPGTPIGLAEVDLGTAWLDLDEEDPHLIVFGDAGSGKSTFLRTWMTGLAARTSPDDVRFVVLDYRRSLLGVADGPHLGGYAGEGATAAAYLQQLGEVLAGRLPPAGLSVEELAARDWWDGPEIHLVVDDYDLLGNTRPHPLAPLADFVPQARDIGLHIVLARRVTGLSRTAMSDPLLTIMRDLGTGGLLLSGDPREGVIIGEHRATQRPPGRGLLLRRSQPPTVVQVAVPD